jgi:hypothetical protein
MDVDGLRACRIAHQRFEHRPAGEHQMAAELLEQLRAAAVAVAVAVRLDQPLLGPDSTP